MILRSSPIVACTLMATAMCTPDLQAQNAFDLVSSTMMEAFTLAPLGPDQGLYITAFGGMEAGDVITGIRHGTGEQAILIIEDSYTPLDLMGIDPDTPFLAPADIEFREHLRQVHGTLIGTAGVVDVTAMSIPDPSTDDGWIILPTHHEASFFDGTIYDVFEQPTIGVLSTGFGFGLGIITPPREDGPPGPTVHRLCIGENGNLYENIPGDHFGALRRFCVCNPHYNCGFAARAFLGARPTCSSTPLSPGLLDCVKAAKCRMDKCLWDIQWNDLICNCEAIKADCERYRRQYGEYPTSPMWDGHPDFSGCMLDPVLKATCFGVGGFDALNCFR